MTRRRWNGRPIVWLIFAAMVGVPSAQLTRLLRAQRGTALQPPVTPVTQAGAPLAAPPDSAGPVVRGPSDDEPGADAYDAAGPANAPIAAAAVSRSGRLVAVLDDSGEVRVWDLHARSEIATIESRQRLRARNFLANDILTLDEVMVGMPGAALVGLAGNDGTFRVWMLPRGSIELAASHSARDASSSGARQAPLVDVEISTEGGALSVSSNGSLAFWRGGQPDDSALIWMSRSPGGSVRDADISPDNEAVAVAAEDGLYLLTPRTRTWTAIDSRRDHDQSSSYRRPWTGSPREVRFSPGGGILAATWTSAEVRVYSLVTRELLQTLRFGREGIGPRRLAFSPDGRYLAATDGQRVIQVWPAGRSFGAPVAVTAPRGQVQSLWFTSDGQRLVISSHGDRYLRTMPLPATQ